jgi:excisionase family DNA binding protein
MKGLLTVDELAAELKVPKSWIYSRTRLRGDEQIPHLKCGKYCRFDFQRVLDWLNEQQRRNMG